MAEKNGAKVWALSGGFLCGLLCVGWATAPMALAKPRSVFCDRTIRYESLTPAEQAAVDQGKPVTRFERQRSGYDVGYIFSSDSHTAEDVMAVYSNCDLHAGEEGMGEFIVKSAVRGSDPRHPNNPFRVFYEQQVSAPFSNGEYTVENTVSLEKFGDDAGYLLSSRLVEASDSRFSPKLADAFLKATPHKGGVFVAACNYMVPRSTLFQDRFNTLARERLMEAGNHLLAWVQRVDGDRDLMRQYRERLEELVRKTKRK